MNSHHKIEPSHKSTSQGAEEFCINLLLQCGDSRPLFEEMQPTNHISSKTIYISAYYCGKLTDGWPLLFEYFYAIWLRPCLNGTAAANRRPPGQDQNLNLQLDDLKKAGCQKIFQEKVSSAKERPQLRKLLKMGVLGDGQNTSQRQEAAN